jgi:hypothetical protein
MLTEGKLVLIASMPEIYDTTEKLLHNPLAIVRVSFFVDSEITLPYILGFIRG